MLPKPPLVIAAVLVLTALPGTAAALGLGGMRTQSALNQPFYAEIELADVSPDEIDGVKARLAPRAEFAKAGAERPHFLTRLQFTPAIGVDDQPYIQVSSREPIREPYLDFLVEVIWPSGRLVKEYTVLLDPPARGTSAPPRVVAPQTSAPRRRPPPEPEPAPPLRRSIAAPQQTARQRQASAPPGQQSAPTPAPVPPQARGTRFPLYYGPVQRGATLTAIARDMTPPGATVQQTAMAIFRNNQSAFMRGNINMLRVGVDLVVPTAEELFALDQSAARREFEDALAGRSVNSSPITDVPSDARLRIAAAGEPEAPPPASSSAAALPAAADPNLRQDLLIVQQTTESNRQVATELRNRIRELEQQLSDIQRLLELRNEQLAQFQQAGRVGEQPMPPGDDLPTPAPPAGAASVRAAPPPPAYGAEPSGSNGDAAAPAADAAPEVEEPAAAPAGTQSGSSTADVGQEPFWQGALQTAQGVTASMPPWALPAAGGTVVLGGLGLLAYRRRRELPDDISEDIAEQAPDGARLGAPQPPRDLGVEPGFGAAAAAAGELSIDSMPELEEDAPLASRPSDGEARGGGAIDVQTGLPAGVASNMPEGQPETQDADVIAEADIYILYGRHREAEALLREELEGAPDNLELRYKLGEALLGGGNRAALAELLDTMRAAGQDGADAAKWAQLESGLAALSTDDDDIGGRPRAAGPRRRPSAAAAAPIGADQLPDAQAPSTGGVRGDDDATDLGFSIQDVVPPGAEALSGQMSDLELDLPSLDDFDNDRDSTRTPDDRTEGPRLSEDTEAHVAARPPLDLHLDASAAAPQSSSFREPADDDRFDLDLSDLEQLTRPPADSEPADLTLSSSEDSPASGGGPDGVREDGLSALPDPLAQEPADRQTQRQTPQSQGQWQSAGASAEDHDEPLAAGPLEDSIANDVLSSQWHMDAGLWDEAATKMDLARAYVEMDDPDAARAILEEVVQEGSEQQRADAKAILAKLG